MMNLETRHGKSKPVIKKALIKLDSKVFNFLQENREKWALEDNFLYPGSIQYFGDINITDDIPISLTVSS